MAVHADGLNTDGPKATTDAYRDGWERIWGKKETQFKDFVHCKRCDGWGHCTEKDEAFTCPECFGYGVVDPKKVSVP